MLKETQDLKNAVNSKATRAQGFSTDRTAAKSTTPKANPEVPTQSVKAADEHALAVKAAVHEALSSQLQGKLDLINGLKGKLESAAVAIATEERGLLDGTTFEGLLAQARMTTFAEMEVVSDVQVSLEYERLTGAEALDAPTQPTFPSADQLQKMLSPAQKARLDQAVLGPAK